MEEHPEARFIVDSLVQKGFIAYYAGGWVRDFLLQRPSDDIDIATNASPEIIQQIFSHTVPIGIAFGIVLVIVNDRQYEVATFREDLPYQDGRRPTGVHFSSPEEDAKRRDFTINGMFYDPIKEKVLDFVGGIQDLRAKIIRAIGDPHERIREDRLRMIRAARLACRFHFTIEEATKKAIKAHAKELFPSVPIERVCQEFTKALAFQTLAQTLLLLHEFGLLQSIFPPLESIPLDTIEKRLKPTRQFSSDVPLIGHLLELFPNFSLEAALSLGEGLKLSRKDIDFVRFSFRFKESLTKNLEPFEWAHLYANPFSNLCLSIEASKSSQPSTFLDEHHRRIISLKPAIERIQNREMLVKAQDLIDLGVPPGKKMGELLQKAEKIAINENLQEKQQVLTRLGIDK